MARTTAFIDSSDARMNISVEIEEINLQRAKRAGKLYSRSSKNYRGTSFT